MMQKMCLYGGALLFVLHMLANKLKITKRTPFFVVVPYLCQVGVKWTGYLWLDWKMEREGLFQKYQIYD